MPWVTAASFVHMLKLRKAEGVVKYHSRESIRSTEDDETMEVLG